jgi:hypothetical protein
MVERVVVVVMDAFPVVLENVIVGLAHIVWKSTLTKLQWVSVLNLLFCILSGCPMPF